MKRLIALLLCIPILVSLPSCGTKWGEFMESLGIDTKDYSSEAVTVNYQTDSDKTKELCELVKMLFLDSPEIEEFSTSSEATELFRDSLLNYMLSTNYARYCNELEELDKAAEEYPQMIISNLIPASEFEKTYYRYFGGSAKITNKSGEYFMYLPKLEAYTALSHPIDDRVKIIPVALVETENTYRLTVKLSLGSTTSSEYEILLLKRDDDTVYFRSLTEKK